jgi:hypothetical protein
VIEPTPDRQNETTDRFWNFLAYLQKYVEVVKDRTLPDNKLARTLMLSTLTEYMRPVLRADLACVGCHSIEGVSGNWLQVMEETIKPKKGVDQQSHLIQRMKDADWRFPYDEFNAIGADNPIILFDQGLQKLPVIFQGEVTALAASQVTLSGREYFLFFFDTQKKVMNSPRYTDFDKAMLKVATGILEIGFQSGIHVGRKESLRNQVFISYSRKDQIWLERLQTAIQPLCRKRKIIVWDDTKIKAGAKWHKEIQNALSSTKVAVLLVSPNFLASDFIAKYEFPRILKAEKEDGLTILWVAVSASDYEQTAIKDYQAAHNPDQPLDRMRKPRQNDELVKICNEIKNAMSS